MVPRSSDELDPAAVVAIAAYNAYGCTDYETYRRHTQRLMRACETRDAPSRGMRDHGTLVAYSGPKRNRGTGAVGDQNLHMRDEEETRDTGESKEFIPQSNDKCELRIEDAGMPLVLVWFALNSRQRSWITSWPPWTASGPSCSQLGA